MRQGITNVVATIDNGMHAKHQHRSRPRVLDRPPRTSHVIPQFSIERKHTLAKCFGQSQCHIVQIKSPRSAVELSRDARGSAAGAGGITISSERDSRPWCTTSRAPGPASTELSHKACDEKDWKRRRYRRKARTVPCAVRREPREGGFDACFSSRLSHHRAPHRAPAHLAPSHPTFRGASAPALSSAAARRAA